MGYSKLPEWPIDREHGDFLGFTVGFWCILLSHKATKPHLHVLSFFSYGTLLVYLKNQQRRGHQPFVPSGNLTVCYRKSPFWEVNPYRNGPFSIAKCEKTPWVVHLEKQIESWKFRTCCSDALEQMAFPSCWMKLRWMDGVMDGAMDGAILRHSI